MPNPRSLPGVLGVVLVITPACTRGGERRADGEAGSSVVLSTTASASQAAPASASAHPAGQTECHQHDTWPLEGHDAQRTSASSVCLKGPLRSLWHAQAKTPIPERPAAFSHAVVTNEEIVAIGARGKASVLHALELTGTPRWDYDGRHDMHWGFWPMVVGRFAAMNDDPMSLFDLQSGKMVHNFGPDSWGQLAADGERFYWTNTWHIHGPPLHLMAASIAEGKVQWEQSRRTGATTMDARDDLGGVTLGDDIIIQVADYKYARGSAVAAFTPSTGKELWRHPTRPLGYASAGAGRLYLVERWGRDDLLVARSQSDGEVVWSLAVRGVQRASPVVSSDLVVIDTEPGVVVAADARSGVLRWTFDSGAKRMKAAGHETSLAAAANDTLVVTAGKEIVLLALSTGEVRWRGQLADRPLHSPVLAGGRLYAIAGGELWVFEGEREI